MEITTQTATLVNIIKNTIACLSQDISKGMNSGERDEIVQSLECGIHALGKLLVLTRWLGRNPVLHDIANFNSTCQQSIFQLHSIIKKILSNSKQSTSLRKKFPEISIALNVLLEKTYPLPLITLRQPDYVKILSLTQRKIWKFFYLNYKLIECNEINVIGGMLYMQITNCFDVWLTIHNLDCLFTNQDIEWRIVDLSFYTPYKIPSPIETIDLINSNLLTRPQYSSNPIQTLISQLSLISKNNYFDLLCKESDSASLRVLFPNIKSVVQPIAAGKSLKIYYWKTDCYLEYCLNNETSTLSISHNPLLPGTNFNLEYSLEKQLTIVSNQCAALIENKLNEQLRVFDQGKESVLNKIIVSPFTCKMNLNSPYLSQALLDQYSALLLKTSPDQRVAIFEDLYIHAHYSQIFTIAKIFFKQMRLEILDEETLKLIEVHTQKFEQIRGEILKPKIVNTRDKEVCKYYGLPFKIQVSENRYLCFIISKTPEENLICVGFKDTMVNYCSCSKEVFNNNMNTMRCIEKISVFCQESFTKYSTKIYFESFKDFFSQMSTTGTLITPLKSKGGYILLNRNLPFIVIVEQPPDESNFVLIVELNNCSQSVLKKFKGSDGFQLVDKKIKLSLPKTDVEKDVQSNIKRLIKFVHLISFVNKVVDKVQFYTENTIIFDGFYIEFQSETFDSVQFNVSLNKKYQHLNELIKFDFIETSDNEGSNKKMVYLKDCGCIQNSLSIFVQYFDGLLKLFSSINTSCIKVSITEFTSVTLFVNTENEKATQLNFVMIFSFNTKLEEKTMSFFSRWLENFGKKRFPIEVFKDTLKQIPAQFKISEAEKYMKVLLVLIHLLLMIEFVFGNTTKTLEGRCHKIIIRPDLFLKIPAVVTNDSQFLATLTQNQHNDCLTRYFNVRFSNPFKSGNFNDAKNLMILMCKKPSPTKILSDFEPLITFCTSSLSREKYKHIYDFSLVEAVGNRYYTTVVMYDSDNDFEIRLKKFELHLTYFQSVIQLVTDRRSECSSTQVIQAYNDNKISSFKDLIALLQQTFEK